MLYFIKANGLKFVKYVSPIAALPYKFLIFKAYARVGKFTEMAGKVLSSTVFPACLGGKIP
jgi:hypothetical protein